MTGALTGPDHLTASDRQHVQEGFHPFSRRADLDSQGGSPAARKPGREGSATGTGQFLVPAGPCSQVPAERSKGAGVPFVSLSAWTRKDAIRVGAMHRMKGLEFQAVAVVGLLFVACTRARDHLYLSYNGTASPVLATGR